MRALLVGAALALGVGSSTRTVEVPSNHGRLLDEALVRLHAAGLRASFPAASTRCGNGLPWVVVQEPRAPARAPRGSIVRIRFFPSPIPSPAVPKKHPKWTTVPALVGRDWPHVHLKAIWPCVHVRAAHGTSATRLVVVAQSPPAGTRVPAYGVMVGRGYRPTTVSLTLVSR